MQNKQEDSIQVCIRIKPSQDEESLLQFNETQIHLQKNRFGFDKIFPPEVSQQEIFQTVGTKLILHTLEGYNSCIFVYGQTGSGKTYTMMGDGNGIMQRSFVQLFRQIERMTKSQCMIYCSYYQIYNEQIIDLLDVRKDKKLSIRQDLKRGVFIQNLVQQSVYSEVKLLDCLNTGMRNRHVGETMMNRESSRSHSIFTISFSIKTQVNGAQVLKTPKLHFVDLAGSERQKMTAASGDRLKQAGNINKSLTTLGMVINALASDKTRTHIPFRDSKLTSLLRDSLGGNSKTYLIATISRNILCFQQTLSTLNFANRAKMVKVKALVNEESLSTNIQTYKQEIRKLKSQILRLKQQKKSSPTPSQIKFMYQKSSQENNASYDNHFKQINDKISVISDHLVKNPISPSLQSLLEQIKNLRPAISNPTSYYSNKNAEMRDQSQNMQQYVEQDEQDPLIQYLSCNNTLLQKIHTKIDEYLQLKQQLRNLAYNNQLTIAALKTPSKFERQQYQSLISNRDNQINQLHGQLRQLRNMIAEQQVKIQQAMCLAKDKTDMSEQNTQRYEKQRIQLQRQLNTLRNLMKQTNQEVDIISKKYQQVQIQCKENKQMYLYAQQNYQTQKLIRDEIQKNLMDKVNQLQKLKSQFSQKISQQKEYFDEIQQGLRQQINVLSQTVEFNQHLIADYKIKIQTQRNKGKQYEEKILQLKKNNTQILQQKSILQQKLKETRQSFNKIQLQYQQTKQQLQVKIAEHLQSIKSLHESYSNLQQKYDENIINYNKIIRQKSCQIMNLQGIVTKQIESRQNMIKQYQNKIVQTNNMYSKNIVQYQKCLQQKTKELEQKTKYFKQTIFRSQEDIQSLKQQLNESRNYIKQIEQSSIKIANQCESKIKYIQQESTAKLQKVKSLQLQNEDIKRQYKHIQKENYRIKAKYSDNNNKTQQELALKVDYYQQKFKLMSIEYQKAMDVVKKLKQKQINQSQKIMTLEESHKVLRMTSQAQNGNSQAQNMLKILNGENIQLKKELQSLKGCKNKQQSAQSYLNKVSLQQQKVILKEKQQYFKQKIQQSINRWDPSKENINKNRSLEELIRCWEDLETQSHKNFDAIAKGIKREQKLKSQNSLILKENIYLKEQLALIQKNTGNPRKIVKMQTKISQNLMS